MSIKLDEDGNINASYLEKELQAALEFDIKYKETDSMKKRAVKIAGSYDEFKNMVACAHLKTLDRGEVESLRHVKKGWQKTPKKKSDTINLEKESDEILVKEVDTSVIKSKKNRKPKTSMEFDRDWRRLKSVEEKLGYIRDVGIKRVCKVLKNDISVETLEQILDVLLQGNPSTRTTVDNEAAVVESIMLLKQIITFDRFALTVRLLDSKLVQRLNNWLDACHGGDGDEAEDVEIIRKAFKP